MSIHRRTHCDCGSSATTIHANAWVCEECKRVVTMAQEHLDSFSHYDPERKYKGQYHVGSIKDWAQELEVTVRNHACF